jgi:hypothetical protein
VGGKAEGTEKNLHSTPSDRLLPLLDDFGTEQLLQLAN